MFQVVFTRGDTLPQDSKNDFALIANCATIEEAIEKSSVSGDLVVWACDMQIVTQDTNWIHSDYQEKMVQKQLERRA